VIVTALSITAAVFLAAFLVHRRNDRDRGSLRAEMARHRRDSEKERQEWIYPFDM
jgi:hypothetical protein